MSNKSNSTNMLTSISAILFLIPAFTSFSNVLYELNPFSILLSLCPFVIAIGFFAKKQWIAGFGFFGIVISMATIIAQLSELMEILNKYGSNIPLILTLMLVTLGAFGGSCFIKNWQTTRIIRLITGVSAIILAIWMLSEFGIFDKHIGRVVKYIYKIIDINIVPLFGVSFTSFGIGSIVSAFIPNKELNNKASSANTAKKSSEEIIEENKEVPSAVTEYLILHGANPDTQSDNKEFAEEESAEAYESEDSLEEETVTENTESMKEKVEYVYFTPSENLDPIIAKHFAPDTEVVIVKQISNVGQTENGYWVDLRKLIKKRK